MKFRDIGRKMRWKGVDVLRVCCCEESVRETKSETPISFRNINLAFKHKRKGLGKVCVESRTKPLIFSHNTTKHYNMFKICRF